MMFMGSANGAAKTGEDIMAKFNGVEITGESMLKARRQSAANRQACIDEVKSGAVYVNDPESYFEWMELLKAQDLAGEHDYTFTMLQRAHTIQTGECVALLP